MKKILIILATLLTMSTISFSQEKNEDKPKLSVTEKQELKKDKEALNLTKTQKAALKKIKAEKKVTNSKLMSKNDRKVAKKKFKAQKMAVLTPEQRIIQKAINKKKKEFKRN